MEKDLFTCAVVWTLEALPVGLFHRWAIVPQYIEQVRIVLSMIKVSGPTIQRDFPSMVHNPHRGAKQR